MTPTETLLQKACQWLLQRYPRMIALYVFGSASSGQRGAASDIDLAILNSEPIEPAQLYRDARALEATLDVDLVDLLAASTVLKKEVIAGGRLLYSSDRDATLDFEARVLSEYGRYREGIGPLLDAVRDSGQAYRP